MVLQGDFSIAMFDYWGVHYIILNIYIYIAIWESKIAVKNERHFALRIYMNLPSSSITGFSHL